jgi:hypothetical protein
LTVINSERYGWPDRNGNNSRSGTAVEFGVSLNNREPLISSDYKLSDLLERFAAEVLPALEERS